MKCALDLCIYNEHERCVLESISIDEMGCCAECIFVTVNEPALGKYKSQLLVKYAKAEK